MSSQVTAPGDPPLLRLRITHITSTMSPPLPTLIPHYFPPHLSTSIPPGSTPQNLPVLRIFGTTPGLQKICANIHLCYPYFFVPYPMDSSDPLKPERVIKLCQRFAVSLNHAICLALRQNPTSAASTSKYGGGVDPRHLHVASVLLVKGTPFYGYHIGWSYYLKVNLVNPGRMYVAMEQLRKPVVLGREWQPHEAHLNHVLQFMCDFDLYGCGWLDLGGGTFREPLPEGDPFSSPEHTHGPPTKFNTLTVPTDMLYDPNLSPAKDTFTPLEIDILPHHILNRNRLKPRNLHKDFTELLHKPLDPDEKLVPAVAELWEDERRRRAMKGLGLGEREMMPGSGGMGGRSMAELGYKVPGSGERVENKGGGWKISGELWGMIEDRMDDERSKKGNLTFERFTADVAAGRNGEKRKYDKWIMTTFEAVSAHWPKGTRPIRPTQPSRTPKKSNKASSMTARSSPPFTPPKSSPDGYVKDELHSPTRPGSPLSEIKPRILDLGPDPIDATFSDSESDSDLDNPFEAFAMTQHSQNVKAEVNSRAIQQEGTTPLAEEMDEEELHRAIHERDAKQHAEEGVRFRATQAAPKGDSETDDYDDEGIDELFRRTVFGGMGTPGSSIGTRTPTRRGTMTPTTGSRTGGLDSRRVAREQRLREQAGFGDLSSIMDRSSVSLSPSPRFDPRLRTPQKPRTPVSEKATPTSLVRNLFARNLTAVSPIVTPTKRPITPFTKPVVLPESKRSLSFTSPPPEDDDGLDREPSPTSMRPRNKVRKVDVKPKLEDVGVRFAEVDMEFPPLQQTVISKESNESTTSEVLANQKNIGPSPTFINEPQLEPTAVNTPQLATQARKRKRVGFESPTNPANGRKPSPLDSSADTLISNHSIPTDHTSGSSTLVPTDRGTTAWTYTKLPPLPRDIEATTDPPQIYQEPYFSSHADVPGRAKMFAGRMFSLKGNGVGDLTEFESTVGSGYGLDGSWLKGKKVEGTKARYGWEFGVPPPSKKRVVEWCAKVDAEEMERARRKALLTSQLAGPTQKNRYGFKFTQKKKTKETEREHQNMSVLALEVFAKSRHQLLPDPEKDALTAVFYCYQNEDETLPDTTIHRGYYAGYVVVVDPDSGSNLATRDGRVRLDGVPCHVVESELDLVNWVIDAVKSWDPDVLAGWELHNASWGYLCSRANEAFGIDVMDQLSRVVSGHASSKKDFYSATHTSTFKVSGRHILNIWRICRSEVNLTQYTFENVVFHVLHQRVPHYSSASLTALWKSKTPEHTHRVLKYFFQRVVTYVEIIDNAEIITKNAEFARVFGVDFASVMFRGSQYKVESFMFRIAKPESFVLVSPSKQQVGLQNAPFATPLIAEPESKYYTHPILVLDFQSLYPSVMIAYNICFSTCLGRVEKFKGTDKFGFTELKVADGLLELLKDYLTVTPNGMIFVKPAVRKSLLAKMLGEILDTRVMVKHAMKSARGDKSLLSLLNARQLGLKLMANVTYGYTSATYSGRMPCIEVADSIVQTGRETLEKAQELIHSRPDWGAQVVYGDTDSLFVALPGRTKEQAFVIGNDIADSVTALNPKPVKLKFEKVYMGSVLMAKKRYVGFKYEHPDEFEPVFDAKGIETIRRDGFPAQQKIEEVCLKTLFRTQDLSLVKEYCRNEWTKILQGRVFMQDFIVAKEVRLGSYSDKGVPPPGAAVAYRRILKDPRDEPQYAERVPYIVSNTEGRRLIDRARMPEEMLANRSLGIDAEYYIRNLLIPPLSRIFNLVGADVEQWFDSMPRTKRAGKYDMSAEAGKMRIDSHFKSSHCMVCGNESTTVICHDCQVDPSNTIHALLSREQISQEKVLATQKICASCSSTPVTERILCDSIDCPVLYTRTAANRDMEDLGEVRGILEKLKLDAEGREDADQAEFSHAMDW